MKALVTGVERWFSRWEHWLLSQRTLGSIPSTHVPVHYCLKLQFQGIWHLHTSAHKIELDYCLKDEGYRSVKR